MSQKIKDDIHRVLVRVLEDWGLMMVDPADGSTVEENFASEVPFYIASLKFDGIVKGSYSAICQEEFAHTLTSNLVGDSGEPSDEEVQDALKELVNVMSGNLLTETWGVDHVFALSSPEVKKVSKDEVGESLKRNAFFLKGDDQPVAFSFMVDNEE